MRPDDFNVHQLVEDLQGTCKTIQEFLPEGMDEDDLTEADHAHIDQEIFNCTECGWWYEVAQSTESADGENVCDECNPDDEEDE